MEELMNNYEEVYNFKRDNTDDLFHEVSSLNNNYSIEESEINMEEFQDQLQHKKDFLSDYENNSTDRSSNLWLGIGPQKDVGILDQINQKFWQKGNELVTVSDQVTIRSPWREESEIYASNDTTEFDLFAQQKSFQDFDIKSIQSDIYAIQELPGLDESKDIFASAFEVEDKINWEVQNSTNINASEEDKVSDIVVPEIKGEKRVLSQESGCKNYASLFSWSQHQAFYQALEGKVDSSTDKGSSEKEINALSIRRSCFRALSAHFKHTFSRFNRAWQQKKRNKKKTKNMDEFIDTYIRQEFAPSLDEMNDEFFSELRLAVIAILHSHRYKKREEFTKDIDFSVIRDVLYSYTLDARDRFVRNPAYALILHQFFVCGGYKYLNSQVQCKPKLYVFELEKELISLHKDCIKTLQ